MIKINEIRIGNYVIYNNNEIGIITGVQDFLTNKGKVAINNRLDIFYNIENINEIALTDEWMFKFNFVLIKNYKKKQIGVSIKSWFHYERMVQIDIQKYNNDQFFSYCFNTKSSTVFLKSVHEMQNLFYSLTYQELEDETKDL